MKKSSLKYRGEIDGLRAIAILPVLLYHAGYGFIPGGYLGVDVFFVISGFLITTILVTEMESQEFSFLRFYERRARRLLPAVLTTILASMALAPFFMWPWQIADLANSALATLFFAANIFFFDQIGYFQPDAENYPLLHMWSLAIEEQYYVLFPVFLIALRALGLRQVWMSISIITVGILSFHLSDSYHERAADAVFYLLPFRAFELAAGSFLAITMLNRDPISGALGKIMSATGLLCIFGSLLCIPAYLTHPFWKLFAIFGTMLILASSSSDGISFRILKNSVMQKIGLISFSLYLVHQPILAFAKLHWGTIPDMMTPALIIACFAAAHLSWKYVERPFRSGSANSVRVLIASIACLGITFGAAYLVKVNSDTLVRVDSIDADLSISHDNRTHYLGDRYRQYRDRAFSPSEKTKILIIGDSHSQDFINILGETFDLSKVEISAKYVRFRCQIYYGQSDVSEFIRKKDMASCRDRNAMLPKNDVLEEADFVILASRWEPWSAQRILETIETLGSGVSKKLIVVGPKHFRPHYETPLNLRSLRGMSKTERASARVSSIPRVHEAQILLEQRLSSIVVPFIDVQSLTCGNSDPQSCPLFTPAGDLISYDGTHLTRRGAQYLGSLLKKQTSLQLIFD
jgi:peptidoglycan/LPS O-acetylase OafA/YrhL